MNFNNSLENALSWLGWFAIICFFALIFLQDAKAQECVPDTGPGAELPAQHSGVILPGQVTVDVSWTPPVFTSDCTLLDSDPALAVTRYELYVSGEPGSPTSAATASAASDATSITQPVDTQGNRLYVMLRACNAPQEAADWCGFWSEQIVKIVAGKPRQLEINVEVHN